MKKYRCVDCRGRPYGLFYDDTPFSEDWPLEVPIVCLPQEEEGGYGALPSEVYDLWFCIRDAFPQGRWALILAQLRERMPFTLWDKLSHALMWKYLETQEVEVPDALTQKVLG